LDPQNVSQEFLCKGHGVAGDTVVAGQQTAAEPGLD
jgi:hypothetical protein